MRNKLNKQKGFAVFEVLFFVLLVAVLIGAAFYVGKKSGNKEKTESNQNTSIGPSPAGKGSSANATDNAATREAKLQSYLVKTCNSKEGAAINAMFANKASQTVETDNFKVSGDYAVINVDCTLQSGTQLSTLFTKYKDSQWTLVTESPEVSCQYLTDQGFPDDLKAPFCQNQEGSFGG